MDNANSVKFRFFKGRTPLKKVGLTMLCLAFTGVGLWYQTKQIPSAMVASYPEQQVITDLAIADDYKTKLNSDNVTAGDIAGHTISKPTTKATMIATTSSTNTNSTSEATTHWTPSEEWIQQCVIRQSKKQSFYRPFKVHWLNYRLGDCIRDCDVCQQSIKASKYKNLSIAGEYWHNACNQTVGKARGRNFTFLNQLFDRYEKNPYPYTRPWPKPADDELVIHLRIGDVMENPIYIGENTTVLQMLRDGADTRHGPNSAYPNGIRSIDEFLTSIRESGLQKIVIRGGSHRPIPCPRSLIYSNCLAEAFQKAGFNVTDFRVNGEENPDQDFFYMARARYFYPSTGGYSQHISTLVTQRGDTLVGRILGG